ncbi:hypothetical protein U9946_22520, partial [Escherichia coli]
VPLDAYVEAFAGMRFGAEGRVEGDPAVSRASSVIDYVFRTLAANYLGRELPEPARRASGTDDAPLLPMALPLGSSPRERRARLRIVGGEE